MHPKKATIAVWELSRTLTSWIFLMSSSKTSRHWLRSMSALISPESLWKTVLTSGQFNELAWWTSGQKWLRESWHYITWRWAPQHSLGLTWVTTIPQSRSTQSILIIWRIASFELGHHSFYIDKVIYPLINS